MRSKSTRVADNGSNNEPLSVQWEGPRGADVGYILWDLSVGAPFMAPRAHSRSLGEGAPSCRHFRAGPELGRKLEIARSSIKMSALFGSRASESFSKCSRRERKRATLVLAR